ncbi:MAG: DUF6262 family protein [Streptosporangiaceae bacterium]
MTGASPAAPRRPLRPENAIVARRKAAEVKAAAVGKAVKALARTGAPVTSAAVARIAGVSRSFIYENPQARALVTAAQARTQARAAGRIPAAPAQAEASWRERALNAEQRARDLQRELTAQRRVTAGLLGQLRQPDGTWLQEESTRLHAENEHLLDERNQLASERNDLQRKLQAARANLTRLTERQVAGLFPDGPRGSSAMPSAGEHASGREHAPWR